MYKNVSSMYQSANVLTANPLKLVIMCYDGAIKSLKIARDAYLKNDYEAKAKALQKTLDIIHELDSSLDMERGADIAKNLRSLYLFMAQALIDADLKRDLKTFDRIVGMLEELAAAWVAISASEAAKSAGTVAEAALKTPGITATVVRPNSPARAWSA